MIGHPLFEVYSYDDLIAGFRNRADELNISRLTIDDLGGLQSGYSGKLLAERPSKNVGPKSLRGLLRALGLKLIAVPDEKSLRELAPYRDPRKGHYARKEAA